MTAVRQESFFDPRCPFCREKIKIGARICPHCRSDLSANAEFRADSQKKGIQSAIAFIVIVLCLLIFFVFLLYTFFGLLTRR